MSENAGEILPESHTLARVLAALIVPGFPRGERGTRRVIGMAGESGSGKTTAAARLAGLFEGEGRHCAIIHQDDYFLRPPRTNHDYRLADLTRVGPHEVNLRLMAEHIAAFRAGYSNVATPAVDYPGNRFLTRHVDFGACDVLIVEGTYVLQLADLDVRIFFDATHEDTDDRRRERARDIDAPLIREVLTIEHALIAPQAHKADIVVDRHFTVRRAE